ncbi:MAG: serine/threonine-protein phosphatase [Mycobacterium sp.]|nr:serine/threonine-protein phosphatase [Mycobacterium sp.]
MAESLIVVGETDRGTRRPDNQDAILLHAPCFAVADGAGGHADGALAAETAIAALNEFIEHSDPAGLDVVEAVMAAHWAVHTRAGDTDGTARMATTLTFGMVRRAGADLSVELGHVGDSQGFLVSDGRIMQLTRDHTVVAELVERGQLSEADASRHPLRNALTRCLGQRQPLQVDRVSWPLHHGDQVLLASDGLKKHLSIQDVLKIVMSSPTPQHTVAELVAETNRRGGSDNVSVVCVKVDGEPTGPRFDQSASIRGTRETAELLIVPPQDNTPAPVKQRGRWWRR